MAVPLERFMLNLLGQSGDRYVWGSEASPLDPDPDRFDCSELIEWAGARSRVWPPIPDGSSAQWEHVRAGRIPVERALTTRGALLWHPGHVAISLGNKTTIEARGRLYGVGTWASTGRFQGAGLFPGIDYQNHAPAWQGDEMTNDDHKWIGAELRTVMGAYAEDINKRAKRHTDELAARIQGLADRLEALEKKV